MNRWIGLSGLIRLYGSELDQVGLTEEQLEDLVISGALQGQYNRFGNLAVDKESIDTYLNVTAHLTNELFEP